MTAETILAGVETGGTKIKCVVGRGPDQILDRVRIPTTSDPATDLGAVADFIAAKSAVCGPLAAVGIGSFGPCDPRPASPTFGFVTSTPKPGWRHTNVVGGLAALLADRGLPRVPIAFDTDVNAAAWGEYRHGAGKDQSALVYVTVGTGIGGGAVVSGSVLHGAIHPEMGHLRIPRPTGEADAFDGVCPYHGDCWEGVAAGPAVAARWGTPAERLADDHPAWAMTAQYIAWGLHALVCALSPGRIVLGGGVGANPAILRHARPMLVDSLAGYIADPAITEHIDQYLVPPGLAGDSGAVGALALAADAAD